MNAKFHTCILCGLQTRKLGELLCLWHDIQAQIELCAERVRERLKSQVSSGFRPSRQQRRSGATKKV